MDTLLGAGLTATAYGGLRSANALLGVLAVASTAPGGPQILASRLPLIEQMARLAGAVLGTQAERFLEFESRHQTVRQVIEGRALRTAFQPVVQLPEGQLVGYEALTRFADGTAPDVMIGEAHSWAWESSFEQACVEIALNSAAQLPAELFLSVNLSPEAVVAGGVLPNLPNVTERSWWKSPSTPTSTVIQTCAGRWAVSQGSRSRWTTREPGSRA